MFQEVVLECRLRTHCARVRALTGAETRIVSPVIRCPSPEAAVIRALRIARPPTLTLARLRRRSVFHRRIADGGQRSDFVVGCLRVTPESAYSHRAGDSLRNRWRAEHDASAHVARIRQQSLVGLGARGNDPGGYSTINEASLRTPPISVRGGLEKCAFVRACRETQLSSRWQRLLRGRDSEGKIKEAAHKRAKPLAGLAFRRAVEEGGELL
jgi:hypothetical protein